MDRQTATARQRDEENKEYLKRNVNDILEPMMIEVVKNRPKDQVGLLLKILGQIYVELLEREL